MELNNLKSRTLLHGTNFAIVMGTGVLKVIYPALQLVFSFPNLGVTMHVFLFALILGWFLLFGLLRLGFFALNWSLVSGQSNFFSTFLNSEIHAFSLDMSMASYLVFLPWLFILIFSFKPHSTIRRLLDAYFFVVIAVYSLVAFSETMVYPEWKTKLNYRAFTVLAHPKEIWDIASPQQLAFGLGTWLFISTVGYLGYREMRRYFLTETRQSTLASVMLTFWPFMLGFAARGGLKPIPIDISRVYFSADSTINDGTANPGWSLMKNILMSREYMLGKNPFATLPSEVAANDVDYLHQIHPSTQTQHPQILNTEKPNVVFIVLESWSADLVKSLGGEDGITPGFVSLEKEGLLFTDFYANGNRSQQGIASIFSGFPALPLVTVTEDPGKVRKLPGIASSLHQIGYETSFLYGGQLEYGNIKSFVMSNGFQNIIEEHQFPKSMPRGSLGIHDGYMYDYLHQHLNEAQQPFATGLFTLSTHAPYDTPHSENFKFSGRESSYIKSAMYADRELTRFLNDVKSEPWYKNTLFVIVADHSHNSYRDWPNWRSEYRKIPLLLYGGALHKKFRGKQISVTGSQVDIASTLLTQMKVPTKDFSWSKDMLDPQVSHFAYYELNNGAGWVNHSGNLVYNKDSNSIVYATIPMAQQQDAVQHSQAYVQMVFQNFLNL